MKVQSLNSEVARRNIGTRKLRVWIARNEKNHVSRRIILGAEIRATFNGFSSTTIEIIGEWRMGVEEGRNGGGKSGAFVNDARVNDSSRFSHRSPMTIGARRYRGSRVAIFPVSPLARCREIFSKFIDGACPRGDNNRRSSDCECKDQTRPCYFQMS